MLCDGQLLRYLLAQEARADAWAVFLQRAHLAGRGTPHRLCVHALPAPQNEAVEGKGMCRSMCVYLCVALSGQGVNHDHRTVVLNHSHGGKVQPWYVER